MYAFAVAVGSKHIWCYQPHGRRFSCASLFILHCFRRRLFCLWNTCVSRPLRQEWGEGTAGEWQREQGGERADWDRWTPWTLQGDCLPQNIARKGTRDMCPSGCQVMAGVGGQCWGGQRVSMRTWFMHPCCLHCHLKGQLSSWGAEMPWTVSLLKKGSKRELCSWLGQGQQQNFYRNCVILSSEQSMLFTWDKLANVDGKFLF